ncbi:MAG TPA: right-handed parallel beta-helix repeat-containing protein [Chloroflexota bacterium]|nr:right-handed parallel beta-helix repeat-containing protein [Chloroflexota bacterium]
MAGGGNGQVATLEAPSAVVTGVTVRVGQVPGGADIVGDDQRALQAAVDYVARFGGGTVLVGPGVYLMRDSLHLRSEVTVRGSGPDTVLRKADAALSRLVLDGDYGEEQITVADGTGFAPGVGVAVWDDRSGGFHTVVGTILAGPLTPTVPEEALGDTFRVSHPMQADYLVSRQARAATVFPVISGYYVTGVRLEQLTIDGHREGNVELNGCRGGGIFLYRGHGTVIADCRVRDYNGDGISFQQSHDVRVERCEVSGCAKLGIHPGSGSQRPVVLDCYSHDNGTIGLFLCWRVRQGRFERNRLEGNGRVGISIGHKDTDNLFVENVMAGNGRYGLLFRDETGPMSGHRNRFVRCTISGNGTQAPDGEGAEVRVEGETQGIRFEDCAIAGAPAGAPASEQPADGTALPPGVSLGPNAAPPTFSR